MLCILGKKRRVSGGSRSREIKSGCYTLVDGYRYEESTDKELTRSRAANTVKECGLECDRIRKLLQSTDSCQGFSFRPSGGGFNSVCLLNTAKGSEILARDEKSQVYQFTNSTTKVWPLSSSLFSATGVGVGGVIYYDKIEYNLTKGLYFGTS